MRAFTACSFALFLAAALAAQPPGGKPAPGAPPKAEDKGKASDKAKPKPKPIKNPLIIKITTTTGATNRFANSDTAKVYVLINGDAAHKHRLTSKSRPFQRGATDKFELKVDFDPAKIESVRLMNESSDMWKCETILFQFFKGGKESRLFRHSPSLYLSAGKEGRAFGARPHVDLKMKVVLEEPKPKKDAGDEP